MRIDSQEMGLSAFFPYTKSEQFPSDIPVAVHAVYADCGWAGMADWLGKG
jgi:hypothetical protein